MYSYQERQPAEQQSIYPEILGVSSEYIKRLRHLGAYVGKTDLKHPSKRDKFYSFLAVNWVSFVHSPNTVFTNETCFKLVIVPLACLSKTRAEHSFW